MASDAFLNQCTVGPPDGERGDLSVERMLVNAFLENIPDIVYFKDRESRFIAVSRSKARRHGFEDPAALIGKTDFDLFAEAHARPARQDEETIMATDVPIIGKIERLSWADGRITWARSSKLPLRDDRGNVVGTFGLSQDITAAREMEESLEKAQKDLLAASRLAGMAEVATGVLHNVGNVLNSLNVSATVIGTGIRQSKAVNLAKIAGMLRDHASDLGHFLNDDPKGRLVPEYLQSLAQHMSEERLALLQEVESLQRNIDHIKEIVTMQQAYATMAGVLEDLSPEELMEDALRMNAVALSRHRVTAVRDYRPAPAVRAERGKVLQILINLIRNAKYAISEGKGSARTLTLRLGPGAPGRVRFGVEDTGMGIPAENLTRIFSHGFTTRAKGHGFGLHSSALAAAEMKGTLTARSPGPGMGAIFELELPIAADRHAPPP